MLKKTGRDIYKLRKSKTASKGQLDVHAFKEKMAFFTNLKTDIPVIPGDSNAAATSEDSEDTASEQEELPLQSSPKQIAADQPQQLMGHANRLTSLSSETVNTLTEDDSVVSGMMHPPPPQPPPSQVTSSPFNNPPGVEDKKEPEKERFSYEIDPDIGVIV